jgi:hypothetical protein
LYEGCATPQVCPDKRALIKAFFQSSRMAQVVKEEGHPHGMERYISLLDRALLGLE